MTEVENLSTSSNDPDADEIRSSQVDSSRMRRILAQHLESLGRSGLVGLPKWTGGNLIEWDPGSELVAVKSVNLPGDRKSDANMVVKETVEPIRIQNRSADVTPELLTGASPTGPRPAHGTVGELAEGQKGEPYGAGIGLEERITSLKVLQGEVAGCVQCAELAESRKQTVFGVGNPSARLVFLGEGPGVNEDRTGEPFVGEAGQLLDNIISACKISRSDVYILNTVKCRPPANRNPSQEELANCWGYAERQLEIIQPEFICCLGSVASKTLLKTTQSLGRLRRQFHNYRGSRVLVTYHPAYLLRTPSAKKHVWEDMKMLMKEMGVDLSN